MTITLAAPLAALAGLAGLVPLAVMLLRERRTAALRAELGLAGPLPRARLVRPAAVVCAFALLGIAAARPSILTQQQRLVRADAQVFFAIDNSRSMLAAPAAQRAPRYRRALLFAQRLHDALPGLEAGIGSLNNRLLPYLFPTADTRAFDTVLAGSYGIERPPPAPDVDHWVTTFDQLARPGLRELFSPNVGKRLLVVLTDGEIRPFDTRGVLRSVRRQGVTPIVVRFWHPNERIFRPDGKPESYHATRPNELRVLRGAGWPAYPESSFRAVVDAVRRVVGPGRLEEAGVEQGRTSIAVVFVAVAVSLLALVVVPGTMTRRRSRRAEAVLGR